MLSYISIVLLGIPLVLIYKLHQTIESSPRGENGEEDVTLSQLVMSCSSLKFKFELSCSVLDMVQLSGGFLITSSNFVFISV